MSKRLAVVSKYFYPASGGGERQILYCIKALSILYYIDVFTTEPGARLPSGLVSPKVSLFLDEHNEIAKSYSRILRQISATNSLYDVAYIIIYQKAAIYHQLEIIKTLKKRSRKVIVRFSSYGEATEFISKQGNAKIVSYIDKIVCLNPLIKQELLNAHCPKEKIYMFRNPVDTSLFYPSIRDKKNMRKKVVVISRPHPKKRWYEIIEAWSAAKWKVSKLTFLYNVNSSQYLNQYKENVIEYTKKLDCYKSIEFIGDITLYEIAKLYRKFDIIISASENEGMQNILLEAVASGLTVIAPAGKDFDFLPPLGVLRYNRNNYSFSCAINTALMSGIHDYKEIRFYLQAYHGLNNYIDLMDTNESKEIMSGAL